MLVLYGKKLRSIFKFQIDVDRRPLVWRRLTDMNFPAELSVFCLFFYLTVLNFLVPSAESKVSCKLKEIEEQKDLKKFVKSRRSILVLFAKDENEYKKAAGSFICEAVETMRVNVDAAFVNCEGIKGKRLCRQTKVDPTHFILQFYLDGQLKSSNYDRQHSAKSLIYFLKNPNEEAPWSEDPASNYVSHLESIEDLANILKRKSSVLIMFYAPWCGHCKRLKPQYATAAKDTIDGAVTLAAMDVNGDEYQNVRMHLNITGFPTLIYFKEGKPEFNYEGEYTRDAILEWTKDPKPFEKKNNVENKDIDWSASESASNVVFLDDETFDEYISTHNSVYVMLYAPWCGHCKKMKPDYEDAANELAEVKPDAALAAVDATASKSVAEKLKVKGFPTMKYFINGTLSNDEVNYRSKKDIVAFMRGLKVPDPVESEKPIEDNWESEKSSVVHLNSESFSTVLKKRKFSLVMFYAPWCGHCKRLKPHYALAAQLVKQQPKVLLAAVDCTKFTDVCSKFEVSGYPTLKVFKYGKEPFDYNGGRESQDFVSFLGKLMENDNSEKRVEL